MRVRGLVRAVLCMAVLVVVEALCGCKWPSWVSVAVDDITALQGVTLRHAVARGGLIGNDSSE